MTKHCQTLTNWRTNLNWLLEHSEVQIQDVAKAVGITPAGLYLQRRGIAEPKISLAVAIAVVFGTTVDDMVRAPAEFRKRWKDSQSVKEHGDLAASK